MYHFPISVNSLSSKTRPHTRHQSFYGESTKNRLRDVYRILQSTDMLASPQIPRQSKRAHSYLLQVVRDVGNAVTADISEPMQPRPDQCEPTLKQGMGNHCWLSFRRKFCFRLVLCFFSRLFPSFYCSSKSVKNLRKSVEVK